jgi:hypothetical protein
MARDRNQFQQQLLVLFSLVFFCVVSEPESLSRLIVFCSLAFLTPRTRMFQFNPTYSGEFYFYNHRTPLSSVKVTVEEENLMADDD